jgi:hypothetical protein
MMFKTSTPVVEPAHDDRMVLAEDPIPLSVIALDLPEPPIGWDAFLASRGIEIVDDDIGRRSVSRADARQLFDEHRKNEAHAHEVAARQEQQAIERDRAFRAALPKGLHWTDIPVGMTAAMMWAQFEKDARPRRRSVLEDALSNSGTTLHLIGPDGDSS